ncbi:MAG: chemotaxis protein [Alphaproteobacteria bacterium]|nr:chemotaxis protein [Alphaproteobacteria bacterium]
MSADTPIAIQADPIFSAKTLAPKLGKKGSEEQAKKIARDFESFFLSQMLQPMFRETTPEAPFSGGAGEEAWRSLQVDEYGKAIARTGGIGISDMIYREILRAQEVR